MTTRDAIEKCKAQGLISLQPPPLPRARRRPNKNVWPAEARERQRVNQAKAWTPERRAKQSAIMKARMAALRATAGIEQLQKMDERAPVLAAAGGQKGGL